METMRSHAARRLCALALALALLGPAAAAGVAHAAGVAAPHQQSSPSLLSPTERIIVHVDGDGDAQWTVSARFALDSENETAAFRRLQAAFENGSDPVGFDATTFRRLADRASDDTGREMAVRNVSYDSRLDGNATNGTGVLNLSFEWTNFAVVDGDRVVVGDAFGDGWHLDGDQTLVVRPPPNHGITDFSPPPTASESSVLRWKGPVDFDEGDPSITYLQGAGPGPGPAPDGLLSDPLVFGGAVLAALVVGGAGAYVLARRRPDGDGTGERVAETEPVEEGATADADDASEPTVDVEADPQEEAETGARAEAEAAAAGGADGASAASDGVDPALLSDEERVERLLEENGGRMKQADIVSETDWSNAKVSQLLSGMADEGRVEKLRIGRENLISLPDEE